MDQLMWDGEQVLGTVVALAVFPSMVEHSSVPLLVAARADQERLVLHPEQISAFLRVHREVVIACHGAGATHRSLLAHLDQVGDHVAAEILWDFTRTGRLHDVELLDQLIGHAGLQSEVPRLPTGAEGTVVGQDGGIPTESILRQTDRIHEVYHAQRIQVKQIIEHCGVRDDVIQRFGPLGLKIRVMAAIASAVAEQNGLRLDRTSKRTVVQECERIRESSLSILWGDTEARRCFKSKGHQPMLSRAGFLIPKPHTLRIWLRQCADDMACLDPIPVEPPLTPQGEISTDPSDWGIWTRCHRLLRAWSDHTEASRLRRCFDGLEDRFVKPRYQHGPRHRSHTPNLEQLRHLTHSKPFRTGANQKFVVVTLPNLDLRALAAVCEHRDYGEAPGQLAGVFRRGEDPSRYAALRFCSLYPEPPKFEFRTFPTSRIRRRLSESSGLARRFLLNSPGYLLVI